MTFAVRRNAIAGIALVAAAVGAITFGVQAGEQDGRVRTMEPRIAPTSKATDATRADTRPNQPVVSVAVSVLDLNTLSASAFGDQDESAR